MKTKTFVFLFVSAPALARPIHAPDLAQDPLRLALKHERAGAPRSRGLQEGWDVQHYEIAVWLRPERLVVEGEVTLTVLARADEPGALTLHADGPEIGALTVGGLAADWSREGDALRVSMPSGVLAGDTLDVTVSYTAEGNMERAAGLNWGEPTYSFHEPEGARRWLVLYDDPADKATLAWRVRAPEADTVIANGVLQATTDNGDGTLTWDFVFDAPIASYLMVLHAGTYEGRLDERGQVPVYTWAYPWLADQAEALFSNTPDMIAAFSELWMDYPWTHYANVLAPFSGAMEHTTATTFSDGLVESEWGELVNAHELAHHWWGDWVTLAEWPEIWLNEGFASYGETLWVEASRGEAAMAEYASAQRDSYLAWRELEGTFPLYDPEYMWGGTVYDKGAFVLHMLRAEVGDDAFFAGLRLYLEVHGGDVATTADLQAAMESSSGEDLSWFFDQWVYQAGEPSYQVRVLHRELKEGYQVDLHVTELTEGEWRVPVELELVLEDGQVESISGWIEGDEGVITACTDLPVEDLRFDPGVRLLYGAVEVFPAVQASAPLTCGEAAAGSGEARGCGCASHGSGPSLGWLGLAALGVAIVRRSVVSEGRRGV